MRVLAWTMVIAIAACSLPAPVPPLSSVSRDDPIAVLVERVKRISDAGDLFDPASIARSAGLELQASSTDGPIDADCSLGYGFTSVRHTTISIVGDSWFRATPAGRGRIAVPAFTINPATTTGDAAFTYRIDRYVHCRDTGGGLVDSTEATLSFEGLPAYACIGPDDLRRLLPASEFFLATDGVSIVRDAGRVDAESGTKTEFIFRAGVPCALAATIRQQQAWGLRFLNANYEYQVCRTKADLDCCSAHPGVEWPDELARKDLVRTSDALCGTPDSIYRQIRVADSAPPPAPRSRNGSRPCD